MTSVSLPHHLTIPNTSATEGGQSFAGINLGSVTYANSNNSSNLNDVLKTLPTAAGASFSAYQRQHDPTCLPNTRVDLLQEIHTWASRENSSSIFWLSGLAGTGKSTIAQTVAAEYHAKGQLAGSFFFSRAGGDISHAGKFVTSLAFQFASNIPDLKRPICDALVKRNDIASQSLDEQWHELILRPLSTLDANDSPSKYVVVVDALDECEDQGNIQIILQLLAKVQLLAVLKLRVLLTSRPEVPIRFGFTQLQIDEHQDFVLHDIEPSIVEHDISVFLRHQLRLIGRECQLPAGWSEERAIERLVLNSGGLFIWAATACRFIKQDYQLAETRMSSLLQSGSGMLPPERKLDEIYTTVLTNSVRGEYDDKETQVLQELFRQVVGTIVTLLDQLSITSLAELLGIDIATLRNTISNLHSVLSVPETDSEDIRLLHPSFRDFLLNQERCFNPHFYIDAKTIHREIYINCLKVMSKHLRRDICNLQHPAAQVADLSKDEVDRHIPSHVQYACRFWVYHFQRSDTDAGDNYDIEVFLQEHFLHWLESLALLNCGPEAVLMIHILDSTFSQAYQCQRRSRLRDKVTSTLLSRLNLKEAPRSKLQAIVHDATRFLLTFRPVLEVAPLQVYYTGLIFSPNVSIVKNTFSHEAPGWFSCISGVLENWDPCLQTLEGHCGWVLAVAFSPDGNTLASASDDHTIKFWDTGSGKALQTLKGHSQTVNDVIFSSDGKTLVSVSSDKTVMVWDVGSGKALQTLKGHSNIVWAVALSSDGKMLASASWDKTVKLWDTSSGKTLQTLKGHSGGLSDVAFSPDGNTLASASNDKTVKLWNTSSGRVLQTLKGHSERVSSVGFSADGKTLVSASEDLTIRLWNISSGKTLQTLRGHSHAVIDVAFSPDSKTLASVSVDKTVKLWDTNSGKALQTFNRHSMSVKAVAFSPDSKTLASASLDKTVKLWDTASGKGLQGLKGHSDLVTDIAISPDGKTLASASWDKTVKLWDTDSGKALKTLGGHSRWVLAVAFSLDGKTLASASDDKTIKLWDTGSWKVLHTLKGHTDRVSGAAFSPNGKMLASASRDETIKLWDTSSGIALQTLNGHSSWVNVVAFSPDGKTLASASKNNSIKLWNVGSGRVLMTLTGQSSGVSALAFLPDGKTLASTSHDDTVRLWDICSWVAFWLPSAPSIAALARPTSPPLILVQGEWILRNRERILWLPSEYRSKVVAVHDNIVGFGYSSGQVLVLNFISDDSK